MLLLMMILMMNKMHDDAVNYNDLSYHKQVALCRAGVKCEVVKCEVPVRGRL